MADQIAAILTVLALLALIVAGCSDDDPVGPRIRPRTLRVPAQFEKIQQAIDAARPGDSCWWPPAPTPTPSKQRTFRAATMTWFASTSNPASRFAGDSDQTGDVILMGNPVNPVINCLDVDAQPACPD